MRRNQTTDHFVKRVFRETFIGQNWQWNSWCLSVPSEIPVQPIKNWKIIGFKPHAFLFSSIKTSWKSNMAMEDFPYGWISHFFYGRSPTVWTFSVLLWNDKTHDWYEGFLIHGGTPKSSIYRCYFHLFSIINHMFWGNPMEIPDLTHLPRRSSAVFGWEGFQSWDVASDQNINHKVRVYIYAYAYV